MKKYRVYCLDDSNVESMDFFEEHEALQYIDERIMDSEQHDYAIKVEEVEDEEESDIDRVCTEIEKAIMECGGNLDGIYAKFINELADSKTTKKREEQLNGIIGTITELVVKQFMAERGWRYKEATNTWEK